MTVIEASRDERVDERSVHEVNVDLRRLRSWATAEGCEAAVAALEEVRETLHGCGISVRSATRIASALARYAFLTEGGCDPSRRVLWRLYAVDGIPPDVLARLTWDQIRPRLREIAVPGDSGTRYFPLSAATCRVLMALRNDSSEPGATAPVFILGDRRPWHPDSLARVLAAISVR